MCIVFVFVWGAEVWRCRHECMCRAILVCVYVGKVKDVCVVTLEMCR